MGRLHALTFHILTILALLALVSYLKILKFKLKWISDVCCGGSGDTEDDTGNGSSGNSTTEATGVTTASDTDSSAIKIGSSLLALFLAKLF